jgi:tellurium resistance protein TerD
VPTNLPKGANVSLSMADPGLRRLLVSMGWHTRPRGGQDVDLDAAVLLVAGDGKVPNAAHFVSYDQLPGSAADASTAGRPLTTGPGTGPVDGDVEQVELELAAVPGYVAKIVFAASIRSARERRQTFADVDSHYIRVANLDTGAELARYDLHEGAASETAMVFGEVYRHRSGDWKFRAVGQGWADGLGGIARDYGVSAG